MITLLIVLAVFGVVALLSIVYISMCFTIVKETTSKQVMRFNAYRKTLLQKEGYILRKVDGEVVEGESRKWLPGGLHWVGLLKPLGIDTIYTRTMKYIKALSDGKYEKRADENTDFLITATQYQYTLVFEGAEDKDGLPLNGQMTMTVMITNPRKALFNVKDWFDALVSRVLPRVRQYISEHRYDKIINDPAIQLDVDVFAMLNDDSEGESIISILHRQYGTKLLALETVNVDPPAEYREATLKKYLAKQNAEVQAQETGGALTLMVDRQIKAMEKHHKLTKEEKKEVRQQCLNMLLRDRAAKTGGLKDIRVGNADGSSFAGGSISEIVGGIVAAVAASSSAKDNPGGGKSGNGKSASDSSGKKGGGQQGGQGGNPANPSPDPVAEAQAVKAADKYFKQYGAYPDWDPLKRTPS